jgi:hypothetical protein
MLCSIAKLEGKDLATIKSLETKLGKTLLAFGCHEAEPAHLTEEELKTIQSEERKLGLSLVAVK